MGAALMIGGAIAGAFGVASLVSGAIGTAKADKDAKEAKDETAKLIAETQEKEEARRAKAEREATYAYNKEQKMMSLKEQALQKERVAAAKYKKNPSTILTERMVDKTVMQTSKQTLGSF